MGVTLTDFIIEGIIREGLEDVRANPSKVDDLFSQFVEPHLAVLYGQQAINSVKTYINDNRITVVQSWAQAPSALPCYSIQLLDCSEDQQRAFISDEAEPFDEDLAPTMLVDPFLPDSYNTKTGFVHVPTGTDLSTVLPFQVFVDASDNKFTIQSGIVDDPGNKKFNIGKGMSPDILSGPCFIESNIDFIRTNTKKVHLNEQIMIGVHTDNNPNLGKYLYYLLIYFLEAQKLKLLNRHIHISSFNASDFNRAMEYMPENIFTRFVTVTALTDFSWNDGVQSIASGIGLDDPDYAVRTQKDVIDRPDGDTFTHTTTKP